MSRQPASTSGWLATMPTVLAVHAREADDDVLGVSGCSSKKSPSSTVLTISSLMS
jgi:hypothetical protein